MLRVNFQTVVNATAALCNGVSGDVLNTDDAVIRLAINEVAQDYWRKMWWPEWTTAERRTFREAWNETDTYAAPSLTTPVEVFYWPTQSYYQTVRAVSANTPPADADGVVDTAYWAASQSSYTGNDWSSASVVYAAGTIVRYDQNGRYYQCYTAHTSSGTLTPVATGGNARWGVLTDFIRNIDYTQSWEDQSVGDVRNVFDRDPYANPIDACGQTKFDLTDRGVVVRGTWPVVWVEFRLPLPSWTGDDYQASVAYAVDDQILWTDDDYYKCVTATTAGQSPVTHASKWSRINFPQVLARATARGAFAQWLIGNGQTDRADIQTRRADQLLADEMVNIQRNQKQTRTWQILAA